MTFFVGQKVVCVISPDAINGRAPGPACVEGHIYTVRDVDSRMMQYGGPLALRFEEFCGEVVNLDAALGGGTWEIASDARNFRPVTDISIFHEILRRESEPRVMATSTNKRDSILNQI